MKRVVLCGSLLYIIWKTVLKSDVPYSPLFLKALSSVKTAEGFFSEERCSSYLFL